MSPKFGTDPLPQNAYGDWLVNGQGYSFGYSKQIVVNMEDFQGIPHLTPSSAPIPKWVQGDGPPSKTRMVRGMAFNAGLQADFRHKDAVGYSRNSTNKE